MHVRPARRGDHDAVLRLADRLTIGVVSLSTRGHFTGESAERGHRCVTLETGAANTSARAFYASLGYLEEDVRLTRPLPPETGDEVASHAP